MCRALALLLLAAEGALAQSWEPSEWDANVSAYGGTVETDPDLAGCPCDPKKHVCSNQTISPTKTEQTKTNELKVTWASKPALKFAYLTDEYGTIISYNANGWNTGTGNEVTFTWDMSQQPTGLVPHLVYAGSCADVVPRIIVLKNESEPEGNYSIQSVITSTWRAKLARWTEEYDVGNSPTEDTTPSDQKLKADPCPQGDGTEDNPCVPKGTPEISATNDITLLGDGDWFTNGGTAKANFPMAVSEGDANALWLTTQDGTIIYYTEKADGSVENMATGGPRQFPRGTIEVHACRLFKTKKVCATASLVDKYTTMIGGGGGSSVGLTETAVGDYAKANKAFTDVFTGYYDPRADRTSIGPKSGTCKQYVIYAKKSDDDSLLAFAFDKPLHFAAATAFKYKVTLTCDGKTRTTGTMDLTVFSAENPATFSNEFEQKVGFKRCLDDHDGHDHAEGEGEKEEEGYPSDNTTWFKHEGRDCMCDMGTLKCKRAGAGSPFSMNEGETVGLVIAVSAIVFICIGAIFFFGYSAMLKRKARDTGVVLQSDGDRL